MNTQKYKTTTTLTGEDFLPLSRHSIETFSTNLIQSAPHKNTLFSEIACQTHGIRCKNTISVTKSLPQIIATDYMKSKLKTEIVTYIKTCPATVRQRNITKKKKTPKKQ